MLGKNLPLSEFVKDQAINNINIFGPFPNMHVPSLLDTSLGNIHVDTLILSWICMGSVLVGCVLMAPRLSVEGGGPIQALLEALYTFLDDLAHGAIGHHYKKFLPLIAAIFIFVLMGNFIGIGPWKAFEHIPGWFKLPNGEPFEIAAPTTDFNVPAGLAVIALLTYLGSGFWSHGFAYFKHLASPIEWLDLLVRPSTLILRLMLVITADELIRVVALMVVPCLLPTFVMGFEIFIGIIQAFVFALLTSIYIGLTVGSEH